MAKRIPVVISQGQSQNPAKRQIEEDLVTGLLGEPGVDVTVIPHLYDLQASETAILALQGIDGDMIVCSWLFDRAAHWTLDRNGIRGNVGTTLINSDDEDEEGEEDKVQDPADDDKERAIDLREMPNRKIYSLDLKIEAKAEAYIEEIRRIVAECRTSVVSLGGDNLFAGITLNGQSNGQANGHVQGHAHADKNGAANGSINGHANSPQESESGLTRIEGNQGRRWYPVIDYSRCTNCMECIDFCLFGVYGVDKIDVIMVEQADACRKGCPACSRVCPENAIMFPQHKTPAIAGASAGMESNKIDLSRLFGAPESSQSAIEVAALERDEQLIAAGREAVGLSVGLPKRREPVSSENKDELDSLIDELDDLDL